MKTTFPKFWRFSYIWTDILQFCETQSETTLHLLESGWYDFLTTPGPCKWETDSHKGNQKHSKEIWWCWAYSTCVPLGLRDGGRNSETKKSKDRHSSEQFHISFEENWQWIRQQPAEFPPRVYQIPFWTDGSPKWGSLALWMNQTISRNYKHYLRLQVHCNSGVRTFNKLSN